MQNQVTVIPADKVISVNGLGLNFNFPAPANMHALQWRGAAGHIEYTDGKENKLIAGEADYSARVAPFVALWEAEKERITPLPPTVEQSKSEAKTQLKAYRQQVEYGGFMLNGVKWDSEQKDELRLNSAYKIFEAGVPEYPGWKVSDGVYITLTPALLQAATMGLMQHYGHAFAVEAAKIAEIDALTTTADVEAWLETELEEGWAQDA